MGNSQTTLAETETILSKEESVHVHEKETHSEKAFLKQYDEVLNKYILHVFRKSNEEYDRPHDHRALKVIDGEVVKLRLDSLHGQADGIKVSLEKESVPMYIWFRPDSVGGKIIFKTVCGDRRKRMKYDLEQITHDFLLNMISKLFLPTHRLITT